MKSEERRVKNPIVIIQVSQVGIPVIQHFDGLCHPERSEGSVSVSKSNCVDVFRFFVLTSSE